LATLGALRGKKREKTGNREGREGTRRRKSLLEYSILFL
jgi:hypothetical protein